MSTQQYANHQGAPSRNPLGLLPEFTQENDLINRKLGAKKDKLLRLVPRDYQRNLYERALKENVIIYLGTGLGKTFIVVLFLNSPWIDRQISMSRKAVFLAPTQDLVKQQAEYINKQVPYRVKIFCGRNGHCGDHIDHWDKPTWDKELENIDLLFLTPQVFAAAISTSLLDWTKFACIIFDECHWANKKRKGNKESGHPYMHILKSYEQFYAVRQDEEKFPRPRLIGLTASLINSMPKNRDSINSEINYLEGVLKAQCVTDLAIQSAKPKTVIHTYIVYKSRNLADMLIDLCNTFIVSLTIALKIHDAKKLEYRLATSLTEDDKKVMAFQNRMRLAASGFSIKPTSFPDVMEGLRFIREKCGLWMLRAVSFKLVEALKKHSSNSCMPKEMESIYQDFTQIMKKIHLALDTYLNQQELQGILTHTGAKPKALLDILKSEWYRTINGFNGKSSFSCIIFVTSRLEVVALNEWLQTVSNTIEEYSFLKSDYAIGLAATMASKYSCITKRKPIEQYKMLQSFRTGLLNTIVTTSVLEEGIDLPICSTVIRYDEPATFRQYVQSRGRARQDISSYITLVNQSLYPDAVDKLNKFSDFEETLKVKLSGNDIRTYVRATAPKPIIPEEDLEDCFLARENSIRISGSTAKVIINMYCNRLAQRTPFVEGVRYERMQPENALHQTVLYLPSGCPISDGISGLRKSTKDLADTSAIVAAVKALYDADELNEFGAPTRVTTVNVDRLLATKSLEPIFDDLDQRQEGFKVMENDKVKSILFKPRMRQQVNYLSENFNTRVYKLLRLKFQPDVMDSRPDTLAYFEKSVYGLIVDANVSNEFIPPFLYGHYGRFEVQYSQITDNLLIQKRDTHKHYRTYTYNLINRWLGMGDINHSDFEYHCQFYIVPMDNENKPDEKKMRQSFISSNAQIRAGDIVKWGFCYNQGKTSVNRPMLVRKVHHDMNAMSVIPGSDDITFKADAESKYDSNMIANIDQPVIEVMDISLEFAETNRAKKVSMESTKSKFIFSQFLVLFHDEPCSIFQAYLLPPVIWRLYVTSSASDLDRNFMNATKDRRHKPITRVPEHPPSELEASEDLREMEVAMEVDEPVQVDNEEPAEEDLDYEGGDCEDGVGEVDEEEETYDDAMSNVSDDTDYGNELLVVGPDYQKMLTKKTMDLDASDKDDLEKWNMNEYEENVPKLWYEHSASPVRLEPELDPLQFGTLNAEVDALRQSLVEQIQAFGGKITGDENFMEESVFNKRRAKVDRSIQSSLDFDRPSKPLKSGSRERGLIEALTQRRAGEPYNLECLENVGDSFMKYTVSVVLFKSLETHEGFLTSARSRLTCNEYFSHLAKKNHLGEWAITRSFSKDQLSYILGKSLAAVDDQKIYYNQMRPKSLADTFESIVGSYLVYQGDFEAILSMEWLGLKIFDENMFDELHEKAVTFSRVPTALLDENNNLMNECYKGSRGKMHPFEKILGYEFKDPSYLVQAFTHASAIERCTRSYERLEFLGDAILDYLVTMTLVGTAAMNDPGQITTSRSALVNNAAFARLAMKYKYDMFILHLNYELYDELTKVRLTMEDDPEMSFLDIVDFDKVVKLLGDVFESVAGAIYLDSGCSLDTVWSVYYPMMKGNIDEEIRSPSKNYLQTLYESFPGRGRISFEAFDVKTEEGQLVGVRCKIYCYDDKDPFREFEANGLSKRQAKLRAVHEAVANMPPEEARLALNREFNIKFAAVARAPRPASGGRGRRGGRRGGSRGRGRYQRRYN